MKALAILFALFLALTGQAQAAFPDSTAETSASFTTVTDTAVLKQQAGTSGVSFQLSGTWAGAVGVRGTIDSAPNTYSPWTNLSFYDFVSGTAYTTAAANGPYWLDASGFSFIKISVTTYTSGTINLYAKNYRGAFSRSPGAAAALPGSGTAETLTKLQAIYDDLNAKNNGTLSEPSYIFSLPPNNSATALLSTTTGTAAAYIGLTASTRRLFKIDNQGTGAGTMNFQFNSSGTVPPTNMDTTGMKIYPNTVATIEDPPTPNFWYNNANVLTPTAQYDWRPGVTNTATNP